MILPRDTTFIGREIMGHPVIAEHLRFLNELADEKKIFRIKIRNKDTNKVTSLFGAKSLESQVG